MSVATGSLSSERRGAFGRIHQRIGTAGMVSAGFVLVVAVLAILAPVASPYSPNAIDLLSINAGPSAAHLLGTDSIGRDLLSRLLWGARSSLLGPAIVISVATVIAVPVAALAGWAGGIVELAQTDPCAVTSRARWPLPCRTCPGSPESPGPAS